MQGFTAVLSPAVLIAHLVSPTELAAMISGSSTPWSQAPRLQEVFQVILDQQLQHEYALLAEVFWEVMGLNLAAWMCTIQQGHLAAGTQL